MPFAFESIYFDNPIVEGRVLDVFQPREAARNVALLFVHGGGWHGGSRTGQHALMRAFNAEGYVCASTDYRLGGVTVFDQIADVRHGRIVFGRWLREHGRPPQIAVFGSSAGAHLAALLAFARPGECGEPLAFGDVQPDEEWAAPVGAVLQATPVRFDPWEDIFPHIWTTMQRIVGTPYAADPALYRRLAPIEYVRPETCPVLFLDAENEHMFPLRYTLEFTRKMHEAGRRAERNIYTNAEHGFFYDVTRRQQQEAFRDMLAFLRSLEPGSSG